MKQSSLVIHLTTSTIVLKHVPFDSDVDVDLLTRIDHSNLVGEILTISALLNRVGLLKADADNRLSEEKLDLDIYEAQLRRQYRSELTQKGQKFTIGEIDDMILENKSWQAKKKKLIQYKRDCDYIDSIYWSVKDKSNKLDKFHNNITPQEFENEIIEGVVNGFMIKKHKRQYPDVK